MNCRNTLSKRGAPKEQNGFTLLEVMVSISIMVIIGTISIVGLMSARSRGILNAEVEKVAAFTSETGVLAYDRVKANNCAPVESVECSEYDLVFSAGQNYQRSAVGGGDIETRVLNNKVQFAAADTLRYDFSNPPILSATPTTGDGIIKIQETNNPSNYQCVVVNSTGLSVVQQKGDTDCL